MHQDPIPGRKSKYSTNRTPSNRAEPEHADRIVRLKGRLHRPQGAQYLSGTMWLPAFSWLLTLYLSQSGPRAG